MNRLMKYVTLKNLVAISLISCGLLSVLILFTGLVFGSDTLDKLSKSKAELTGEKADPSIVDSSSDESGLGDEKSSANGSTTGSNGSSAAGGASGTSSSAAGSTSGTTGTTSSGTKTTGGATSGGSSSSGGATAAASISSFSASPASISYNSASTLSWASANASSCSISTLGAVAVSGTKSTGNLTSSKTYTLTCGTATKNVSVSVGSAPVSCGQPNGVCTSAQVAAHASQGDCWMVYNGYYYIVTSYVNNHPGGRGVFNTSSCGHDITAYMNGTASTGGQRHSHNNSAYNVLNSYRVGQVQG